MNIKKIITKLFSLPVVIIVLPIFMMLIWSLSAKLTGCSGFEPCSHFTGSLTSQLGTFALLSFIVWPLGIVLLILYAIFGKPDKHKNENRNKQNT